MAILAHGLVQRATLPIPEELFAAAAALVLVVSFVALAVLWPSPRLGGAICSRTMLPWQSSCSSRKRR